MDPFVALTTTVNPQGGDYRQPQVAIYANYLRLLQRVGLVPVLVSPAHDVGSVASLVRGSAGLVLSGGEDILPERYGEAPLPEVVDVNPARDAMEWSALDVALDEGMPVLGICRGMQVLNVYFGGSLFQDLPSQRAKGVLHHQQAPWGQHQHAVQCRSPSRLHAILGDCLPLEINSFHHQAVKEPGRGLRVTAEAEDGLIEGIEAADHDWVVGIQWHPERGEAEAPNTDPNIRIVSAFADAVRAYAGGRALAREPETRHASGGSGE